MMTLWVWADHIWLAVTEHQLSPDPHENVACSEIAEKKHKQMFSGQNNLYSHVTLGHEPGFWVMWSSWCVLLSLRCLLCTILFPSSVIFFLSSRFFLRWCLFNAHKSYSECQCLCFLFSFASLSSPSLDSVHLCFISPRLFPLSLLPRVYLSPQFSSALCRVLHHSCVSLCLLFNSNTYLVSECAEVFCYSSEWSV